MGTSVYFFSRAISRQKEKSGALFFFAIGISMLPLLIFRYGEYHTSQKLIAIFGVAGISFFTLQAIGYLTDIFFEKYEAENDFVTLMTFLFFPTSIVAGPIERGDRLIPQLRDNTNFSITASKKGLLLIAFGLIEKMVIADRIQFAIQPVLDFPHYYSAIYRVIAGLLYPVELYADFLGYSEMAIGVGLLFGVQVIHNFDRPYSANNIQDFWKRWHISLSSFLQDYIFKPLATQVRSLKLTGLFIAAIVTFFISGLWHGTGENFLLWGLLHGSAIGIYFVYSRSNIKLSSALTFIMFYFFLWVTWILFGTKSFVIAGVMLKAPLEAAGFVSATPGNGTIPLLHLFGALAVTIAFLVSGIINRKYGITEYLVKRKGIFVTIIYYVILLILLLGPLQRFSYFIYEQF